MRTKSMRRVPNDSICPFSLAYLECVPGIGETVPLLVQILVARAICSTRMGQLSYLLVYSTPYPNCSSLVRLLKQTDLTPAMLGARSASHSS